MELYEKLDELKEELFNLRFQHATGQLENPMRIKEARRDIAKICTVLTEREFNIHVEAPVGLREAVLAPPEPEAEEPEEEEELIELEEEPGEEEELVELEEEPGEEEEGLIELEKKIEKAMEADLEPEELSVEMGPEEPGENLGAKEPEE